MSENLEIQESVENEVVHDARSIDGSSSFFVPSTHRLGELKNYKMTHPNRGKAIIFNHKNFKNSYCATREGTEADVANLNSTLLDFGFSPDDILIYDDLTYLEIVHVLRKVSADDHSDNDLLMVFVLTHGDNDEKIMAYDECYTVDTIWKYFTADNCKSLAEKPKIFFIIACRGKCIDRGVKIPSHEEHNDTVDALPFHSSSSYVIPVWSDFLCVFSTYKGFYSYRNTKWGTWFVQAFCEQASKTDFTQVSFSDFLTGVNGQIARTFQTAPHDLRKQVSVLSSTLTKRLYLTKKGRH